jgi:hypothetical protein
MAEINLSSLSLEIHKNQANQGALNSIDVSENMTDPNFCTILELLTKPQTNIVREENILQTLPPTQPSSFLEITNEDFTSPTNIENNIIQNTDIHPIETKLFQNDGIIEVGKLDIDYPQELFLENVDPINPSVLQDFEDHYNNKMFLIENNTTIDFHTQGSFTQNTTIEYISEESQKANIDIDLETDFEGAREESDPQNLQNSNNLIAVHFSQNQNQEFENHPKQQQTTNITINPDYKEQAQGVYFEELLSTSNENKDPNRTDTELVLTEAVSQESGEEIIPENNFASKLKSDIQKIDDKVEFKNNASKTSVPIEHIHIEIDKAIKTGNSEIKIALNPEKLGVIDVKISISENGTYSFDIVAENKDTLELLLHEVRNLENQIKEVTKSENSSFSFNLKDENNHKQRQQQEILELSLDENEEKETYSANYAYGFHNKAEVSGRIDISV